MLLAGCAPPDNYEFSGTIVWDLFPFDGNRTWEFINTDETVTYKLKAQTRPGDPDSELSDLYNIYRVDYMTNCVASDPSCVEDEIIRTVGWSSDVQNGVLIHSFQQDSWDVVYDPPIQVSAPEMLVDETLTTVTDGFNWTSTLVGFEHCPVHMNVDWGPNCGHFTLDDGDGDELSNFGLSGDYWAIKGQNVVSLLLLGETGDWQLSESSCEPDEECRGDW